MLYQLSYARVPSGGGRIRTFVARKRGRFTVCSLWPLGHPTTPMLRAPRSLPGPRLPSPTDNAPRVPRSAGCAGSPDRVPPPDNDFGKPSILFRAYEVSQPRVVGDPLPNPGLGWRGKS